MLVFFYLVLYHLVYDSLIKDGLALFLPQLPIGFAVKNILSPSGAGKREKIIKKTSRYTKNSEHRLPFSKHPNESEQENYTYIETTNIRNFFSG